MNRRWTLVLVAGLLLPLIIVLSIWWPLFSKYAVWGVTASDPEVERLLAEPSDAVLAEIGRQSLAVSLRLDDPVSIRSAAEAILLGNVLELPRYPRVPLGMPFTLDDLNRAGDTLGLHLGSLADVKILLDAYELTKREDALKTAVARYIAFVEAERKAWMPVGFLWNDHAIAARISLSARLWAMTRHHPQYGASLGKPLATHVARSIRMLARPTQYTFTTNHGVMQNVALLQAAAAFPGLSEARALGEIGRDRLDAQLGHYLSSEGMVLEHSVGYHKHGVELLTIAIRAAELAGIATPEWRPKVIRARNVLEAFRRPDGSLPRIGNTHGSSDPVIDYVPLPVRTPGNGLMSLPLSGYALWRSSTAAPCGPGGTHLAFAASYFHGHGHKLADEGSLSLWSGGQVWIDNTGYWPFGYPGRIDVDGWRGGNAPHLVDEKQDPGRVPTLTHAHDDGQLQFLAFERQGSKSPHVGRQVVGVEGTAWLVVDTMRDAGRDGQLESLWTVDPGLLVKAVDSGGAGFEVSPRGRGCVLDFRMFEALSRPAMRTIVGQKSPFGGWMMQDGAPTPTTAIEVRSPSTAAVLLAFRDPAEQPASLRQFSIESDRDWRAVLALPGNRETELIRKGDQLTSRVAGLDRDIVLERIPSIGAQRAEIAQSLDRLAKQYPPMRDYYHWRLAMTKLLILAGLVVMICLAAVNWRWPSAARRASYLLIAFWMVEALWMHLIYFA